MRNFLLFILCMMLFSSCGENHSKVTSKEEKKSVVDVDTTVADSKPAKPKMNIDSLMNAKKKDYKFERDEFSSIGSTYVIPKSAPKYRNQNGFYCYFTYEKNYSPGFFRFVIQYESDNWLFIDNCIFNIDGENINFTPKEVERDNSGGRIWEWVDQAIEQDHVNLIRKIANAKSVKVKLNGKQYYDTRSLKENEIKSIKETLELWENIGGKFYDISY